MTATGRNATSAKINCLFSILPDIIKPLHRFDYVALGNATEYLQKRCLEYSEIWFPGTEFLNNEACHIITGLSRSPWTGWSYYPFRDIWQRIIAWKVYVSEL